MHNNDKKIYCISTIGGAPCGVLASWRSGQLSIVQVDHFPVGISGYLEPITKLVKERVAKGFLVFIEEGFTSISVKGAYQVSMETLDEVSGVTVVNTAMKQYRAMNGGGIIAYGAGISNIAIPQSNIDEIMDDKGRTTFKLEWEAIRPHHRALLLVVYAVVSNNPSHLPILKAMFASVNSKRESVVNRVSSKMNALAGYNQEKHNDLVASKDLADINSDHGIPEGFTYVK